MNTPSSSTVLHSEAFRLLPWFVNGQLDPGRLQLVAAHVQGCLACRREADGLTQLFCAHAQLSKPRLVDETRLDALFARIERYEASQRRPPRARNASSSFRQVLAGILQWFDNRLMLVGGACAAALLAIVLGPMLLSPGVETGTRQHVLSSPETVPSEVRVKLEFRSPMSPADAQRVISNVLAERNLQIAHRIEQRSPGEYVLVLEQKPDLAALSAVLGAWEAAPEVASATIDDTASSQ